jgi:hypothetical protein
MTLARAALGGYLIALATSLVLPQSIAPANAQRRVAPSLDAETVVRGRPSEVNVNLSVSRKAISLRRLVVRVRGTEVIDMPYTIPEEKDSKGKLVTPARDIKVQKSEVIFEREFTITTGHELDANTQHKFTGEIEIPANLPPSFRSKFAHIKWEARAETDLPGGILFGIDPSSNWIDLNVR